MRIALVHDYLNQFGGAERVVAGLTELFPEAPIYTSICDPGKLPEIFLQREIRTSFMQKLPFALARFKWYFALYPLAFESFDLSEFDVIISSSSAYAKGVKKTAGQLHICYCHTPARFIWRYDDYVKRESVPGWGKSLLPFFLEPIKQWDLRNSQNVDYFLANSRNVAGRIKRIYGRESAIIYPPVETELFRPSAADRDYFLIVSRLNSYKRLDIAVEAFSRLDLPLKIAGDGPDRRRLEKLAGRNVEFLGRLPDAQISALMAECRANIFTGEEDFGIVPLEAMACGRPVIAYRAGGAEETILEGTTGIFFEAQTAESLMGAVKRFNFGVFDKQKIRDQALKFSKEVFGRKIGEFVREKYEEKFGQ